MASNRWASLAFYSSLVNGVSQQPPRVRQESHCDEAVNVDLTLLDQVSPRPPLEVLNRLEDMESDLDIGTNGYPFTHQYTRDSEERYNITFDGNGGILVHDLDTGEKKTVNDLAMDDYLDAQNPEEDFFCLTYKDTTFVVNRLVTVALASTLSPVRGPEGIIKIKDYVAGATFSVTVKFTGAGGTVTVAPTGADVNAVASDLVTKLLAHGNWPAGMTAASAGNVVHISKSSGSVTALTIQTSDNRAGTAIMSFTNQILRTADLPAFAPHGYQVEVTSQAGTGTTQSNSASDSQYYVFESADGATFGEGKWVESVAPGIKIDFDAETMPHTLTRQPNGEFDWNVVDWGSREVGDSFTNPDPLFVGQKIFSLFLVGNRFGVLASGTYHLSRVGEESWFEMFKQSTTQQLDDDPIYGIIPTSQVGRAYWGIPWNGEIVILGDPVDGVLSWGSEALTSRTVTVTTPTSSGASPKCAPVIMGSEIFYITEEDEWANVGLYSLDPTTGLRRSEGVTDNYLAQFIPAGVKRFVGRSKNRATILSTGDRSRLFGMTYSHKEGRLIQRGFVEWDFSDIPDIDILDIHYSGRDLIVVFRGPDEYFYSGRVRTSSGAVDEGFPRICNLDFRLEGDFTASYSALTGVTTLTLPWDVVSTIDSPIKVVVGGHVDPDAENATALGEILPIAEVNGDEILLQGDFEEVGTFFVGYHYDAYIVPNPLFQPMVDPTKQGRAGHLLSELNLARLAVGFHTTQFLKVEVISLRTGRTLGMREFIAGLQFDNIDSILDANEVTLSGSLLLDGVNARMSEVRIKIGASGSHLPWSVDSVAFLVSPTSAEV